MVALNDNFTKKSEAGVRKQQSEKSADRFIPASRRSPRSADPSVVQHQFLFVDRGPLAMERSFDAMDRRVRKTIFNGGLTGSLPNGNTDYVWSGWSRRAGISAGGALAGERLQQVMEERNTSDAPIRQYVWGTYPDWSGFPRGTGADCLLADTGHRVNIDECIELTTFVALGSQNLAPGSYYLLQDLLYRAVALTNSSGSVVEAYDTDAYGNTLIFTAPGADGIWFTDDDARSSYGANEIIYCGYRFDPESELYYVRNRSYNTVLGRWIQRDPIGYAGGVNLYECVGGNPAAGVDASGEKWVKLPYELCKQYVKEPHWYSSIYDIHFQHAWIRRGTSGWGFYPKSESVPNVLCSPGVIKDNSGASMLPGRANAPMGGGYKVCEPVWVNTCECNPKKATAGIAKAIQQSQKHPPEYGLFFYDCVDWAGQQLTWGAISGCKGWRKGYGLGWGTLPVQISGVNPGGPAKFWP